MDHRPYPATVSVRQTTRLANDSEPPEEFQYRQSQMRTAALPMRMRCWSREGMSSDIRLALF